MRTRLIGVACFGVLGITLAFDDARAWNVENKSRFLRGPTPAVGIVSIQGRSGPNGTVVASAADSLTDGSSCQEIKPMPAMEEWEKDVRKRMGKDETLKKLAGKYPLVLLHSRKLYADGDYKQSAFSFIYETSNEAAHFNDVQLMFDNGRAKFFHCNMVSGQKNFTVDLGKVDFEKDPNHGRISIENPGISENQIAEEGHVYLEAVRDKAGNNFYALFQIVAVDAESRYMAFLWRKLPGGKVVKRRPQPKVAKSVTGQLELVLVQTDGKPVPDTKAWIVAMRMHLAADQGLRKLATKYPMVLLQSRAVYGGEWGASAYSFVHETSDDEKHRGDVQIIFDNGGAKKHFQISNVVWPDGKFQQNLVVDLGKAEFENNPDTGLINIDHPGLGQNAAINANVYLERVRDNQGTCFYVLFQVVGVDPEGRYAAFIWRTLPGGKNANQRQKK